MLTNTYYAFLFKRFCVFCRRSFIVNYAKRFFHSNIVLTNKFLLQKQGLNFFKNFSSFFYVLLMFAHESKFATDSYKINLSCFKLQSKITFYSTKQLSNNFVSLALSDSIGRNPKWGREP